MTPIEHVIGLAVMALAILTLLVVFTLAAAEILPLERRRATARVGRRTSKLPRS